MFATIPPPAIDRLTVGPLTVHVYGMLVASAAILGTSLARRRYAAIGGNAELIDRVALWTIASGVVGARVSYVIPRSGQFVHDPLRVFAVWEGGLAYFGGLSAAVVVGIYLVRRAHVNAWAFADAVFPGIPLGQALGRLGNYFNQELFGTPTKLPWALKVDPQHRVAPYLNSATFHPTFLYESLFNVTLGLLMFRLAHKHKLRRGSLVFVYLAGYGFARFLLELIRTDTTFRLLGISRNGYASLVACAVGVAGMWWRQRADTVATDEPLEPDTATSDTATPNTAHTPSAQTDSGQTPSGP